MKLKGLLFGYSYNYEAVSFDRRSGAYFSVVLLVALINFFSSRACLWSLDPSMFMPWSFFCKLVASLLISAWSCAYYHALNYLSFLMLLMCTMKSLALISNILTLLQVVRSEYMYLRFLKASMSPKVLPLPRMATCTSLIGC